MSGFAEYRRNQKALEHGLTEEGVSVWEDANKEFIQKHWSDAQRIYSEKFPAADIDGDAHDASSINCWSTLEIFTSGL